MIAFAVPLGATKMVSCDPVNPEQAVLEGGIPSGRHRLLGVGAAFIFIGGVLAASA